MKDRFGKPVLVAWAAHEILWLEAALSLPKAERIAAYVDISSMTGRSIGAISGMASKIRYEKASAARGSDSRLPLPPGRALESASYRASLMAGKASVARSPITERV